MSEEEAVADTTTETTDTSTDAQAVADAVAGDRPDWLLDRYMTEGRSVADATAEQAKGYNEIRGQLGSFTGAPDAYDFALSEELTSKGIELDLENPLIASFTEMAKESNMSNEMANKIVNMYVEGQYADSLAGTADDETFAADQMKLLGDSAQARVDNISKWITANMDPDSAKGLEDVATTADGVKAIEALIAKTRNAPLVTDDTKQANSISADELHRLQFATDENGNRKMSIDPEYRRMVEEKYSQLYPGENIIQVG